MMRIDKPRLRNTLRKLRAVEAQIREAYDPVEIGQEMLDLLAVMAGIKPVFLHGRGLVDAAWLNGVVEVARGAGLHVLPGPCWNRLPPGETYPGWYVACIEADFAPFRPFYICRAKAVVEAVAAVNAADGRLAVAEEARLLGYPECCVGAHHHRSALFHEMAVERLERAGGGDEARMRALYAEDTVSMKPETERDEERLAQILDVVPTPFTSWNACPACQDDEDAPSIALLRRYEDLAWAVDPALHDLLMPREEEDGEDEEQV